MNPDMLELLINKYLDSEITPAEMRLLDQELTHNPNAPLLLEELRHLKDRASQTLIQELNATGKSPKDTFDQAWQKAHLLPQSRKRMPLWLHNVTSIAAGFLLGLTCYGIISHWASDNPAREKTSVPESLITAQPQGTPTAQAERIPELLAPYLPPGGPAHHWTHYTDPSGRQWLIETPASDNLEQANYHGDL